ncbi:MAG: AsnC family transcriptional regulator [Dehalococcoidia bacterium]
MTNTSFDPIDRQIMNVLQSDFPLVEAPYRQIAEQVGISEEDLMDRVRALKKKNVVRQVGAIFDTRRLGYKSTLVAMKFAPDQLDFGAHLLNRHPGISHNYARDGHFNLWFTLAVPPGRRVEDEVEMLARAAGAEETRLLPTIRFFKIGVNFDMVKQVSNAQKYFVPDGPGEQDSKRNGANASTEPGEGWNVAQELSERDIAFIMEMQEDLPVVSRPFDGMAERLGMTVQDLFSYADQMVERRLMRRYSAVLYHRRAGFSANAMIVWRVPEERAQEVGEIMAQSPAVTHCYQRPTYPDWKYTHFTMIHATSRTKCEEVADEIQKATGIDDRLLLYSTREYKKTRVRYFVEDEFKIDAAVTTR